MIYLLIAAAMLTLAGCGLFFAGRDQLGLALCGMGTAPVAVTAVLDGWPLWQAGFLVAVQAFFTVAFLSGLVRGDEEGAN